jgi:hypothetical protein
MKKLLFLIILICIEKAVNAQYIYTIKADSVKITNSCDTAELIIENHTQNVPGFLFNKGRGRTEFRRAVKLNDSTLLLGNDTVVIVGSTIANNGLSTSNRYVQLGQAVGAAGNPAALNNNREIPLNGFNTVFTGSGKIGIGTNEPAVKLDVGGNIITRGINGDSSYIGLLNTDAMGDRYTTYLGYTSPNKYIAARHTIANYVTIANLSNTYLQMKHGNSDWEGGGISRPGIDGGETRIYSNDCNHLGEIRNSITFFQNNTERMRIHTNGNVGIGITSPTAKLDVQGDIITRGIDGGNSYIGHTSSFAPGGYTYNTFLGFANSGNCIRARYTTYNWTAVGELTNNSLDFQFGNGDAGGGISRYGVQSGETRIYSNDVDIMGTPRKGYITFHQNGTEQMRIHGDGKIGIGTGFPADKLHVSGTARITDTLKMPNITSKSDTINYKPVAVDANGNIFKMTNWPTPLQEATIKRTAVNDAGYSAGTSDHLIAYTSLTAARTVTLPAASGMTNRVVIIKDESGTAATNNITVNVTAGGTIDGASSKVITTAYGMVEVYSNGSQWFTK